MNKVVRIKPAGEKLRVMEMPEAIDHFATIKLGTKQLLSEAELLRRMFKVSFIRDGIYRGHKYEIEVKHSRRFVLDPELVASYVKLNGGDINEFYKPVDTCEMTPRPITPVEAKIVRVKTKRKARAARKRK